MNVIPRVGMNERFVSLAPTPLAWARTPMAWRLYSTRLGMRLSILARQEPREQCVPRQEPRNKGINPHRVKYKHLKRDRARYIHASLPIAVAIDDNLQLIRS